MPAIKAITFTVKMPINRLAVMRFALGPRFGQRFALYLGVELSGVPTYVQIWNAKHQIAEECVNLFFADGSEVHGIPCRWLRIKGNEEN